MPTGISCSSVLETERHFQDVWRFMQALVICASLQVQGIWKPCATVYTAFGSGLVRVGTKAQESQILLHRGSF